MNTKISAKEIVRRTGEKILTSKQPGTRDIWTKQWLKMEPKVLEKVQQCISDINYLQTWNELAIAQELGSTSQVGIKLSQQIRRVVVDVVRDLITEHQNQDQFDHVTKAKAVEKVLRTAQFRADLKKAITPINTDNKPRAVRMIPSQNTEHSPLTVPGRTMIKGAGAQAQPQIMDSHLTEQPLGHKEHPCGRRKPETQKSAHPINNNLGDLN